LDQQIDLSGRNGKIYVSYPQGWHFKIGVDDGGGISDRGVLDDYPRSKSEGYGSYLRGELPALKMELATQTGDI
jgi:hypothetical protein